jgi:hypothetical protein
MSLRITALIVFMLLIAVPGRAQQLEGEYLYQVTTLRADAGRLSELLDWLAEMKKSTYYKDSGDFPPFVMRHSQGDQWDLMIVSPMANWTKFHSQQATNRRSKAQAKHAEEIAAGGKLVAFSEDHFAYGPPVSEFKSAYAQSDFFHIEMFTAEPGKASELLKQRLMENAYLAATGQSPNMIFHRAAGSDVDVFTIGFYESLEAFAAPAPASDEEKEVAAKAAGFANRADLSFYLRSLINGHHDTLAVKVE